MARLISSKGPPSSFSFATTREVKRRSADEAPVPKEMLSPRKTIFRVRAPARSGSPEAAEEGTRTHSPTNDPTTIAIPLRRFSEGGIQIITRGG